MPSEMVRKASMSRPESVSSRIATRGSRTAIWRISFRFFSPPENPSFTLRCRNAVSIWTSSHFCAATPKNSSGSSSGSPAPFLLALSMSRKKSVLPTPGSSTGYWNARKMPALAASWASSSSRSSPSSVAEPAVASYAGCRARTFESVDFPEPLVPMMAWTSPALTSRSTPFKICLSTSTTLASRPLHERSDSACSRVASPRAAAGRNAVRPAGRSAVRRGAGRSAWAVAMSAAAIYLLKGAMRGLVALCCLLSPAFRWLSRVMARGPSDTARV
mmetsp:Transcript_19150/g.58965  ORF Transcript_19150/g.58965 Transcript_19150/m.58965 type:complete len:274 (-) Transcript_19150:72-893(-)